MIGTAKFKFRARHNIPRVSPEGQEAPIKRRRSYSLTFPVSGGYGFIVEAMYRILAGRGYDELSISIWLAIDCDRGSVSAAVSIRIVY